MFFCLSTRRIATLTALLCVGGFLIKGARPVPGSNRWASAYGRMQAPRSSACSVLLADGRVLITGGVAGQGALSSSEFFGVDGRFVPAAPMMEPRSSHACALLPDGSVIVAGGRTNGGITDSVEIFDPAQNSWRSGPALLVARAGAAVVTLNDTRILIAGGATSAGATDSQSQCSGGRHRLLGSLGYRRLAIPHGDACKGRLCQRTDQRAGPRGSNEMGSG